MNTIKRSWERSFVVVYEAWRDDINILGKALLGPVMLAASVCLFLLGLMTKKEAQ